MNAFSIIVLLLLVAKWAVQQALEKLNQRHAQDHAHHAPEALQSVMAPDAYAKSVEYTLAKSRFAQWEGHFQLVMLIAVLFSGLLPWSARVFAVSLGTSVWAMAAFLFLIGFLLHLPELPWEY